MTRTVIYYFLIFIFPFLLSCSGNDPGDPPVDMEPVWDKTRTVRMTILSDLTGNNPFTVASYPTVATFAEKDDSHLFVLDKANVRYTAPRLNTGAKIAVPAERVPIFVTSSVTPDSYIGSVLFFQKTVQQMELTFVMDDCRLMQMSVDIKPGLNVNVILASFMKEAQVTAAAKLIQSAIERSVLVTGTILREHLPVLRSSLSALLQENAYEITVVENSNNGSAYCLYTVGSKKWKFRKITEGNVQNTIKSFLLEVEYLK